MGRGRTIEKSLIFEREGRTVKGGWHVQYLWEGNSTPTITQEEFEVGGEIYKRSIPHKSRGGRVGAVYGGSESDCRGKGRFIVLGQGGFREVLKRQEKSPWP